MIRAITPLKNILTMMLCAALVLAPLYADVALASGPKRDGQTQRVSRTRKLVQRCVGGCKAVAAAPGKFVRNAVRVRRGTATPAEVAQYTGSLKSISLATMAVGWLATVGARAYGFDLDDAGIAQPLWLAIPREGGIAGIAIGAANYWRLSSQLPAASPPESAPTKTP